MAESGQSKAAATRDCAPSRVIIEAVRPAIDEGRFPIKRTIGEEVVVTADIFAEGHDVLSAVIQHRDAGEAQWHEVPMAGLVNDAWTGRFLVATLGWHEYRVLAWVDRFATWHRELTKKSQAGQDVSSELLEGAELVRAAAGRATGAEAEEVAERLRTSIAAAPIAGQAVTMSFGVAASDDGEPFDFETFYARADLALYRAKRGGRDRVCGGPGEAQPLLTDVAA